MDFSEVQNYYFFLLRIDGIYNLKISRFKDKVIIKWGTYKWTLTIINQ